jgi:hypothetical protein
MSALAKAKKALDWAKKNKTISGPIRRTARTQYWQDKVNRLDKALERRESLTPQERLVLARPNWTRRNYPEGKFFPFEEGTRHYRQLRDNA